MVTAVKTTEIVIIECNDKKYKYLWAWRESADKKVFGTANSIEEIKRRACKFFPNDSLVYTFE